MPCVPGNICDDLTMDFDTLQKAKSGLGTAALIAGGLFGARLIEFEFDPLKFFESDDPIFTHTRISDETMGGSSVIEILVDTGRENGLHDPDLQRRLSAFEAGMTSHPENREIVRKAVSVNGVLKEIHQALTGEAGIREGFRKGQQVLQVDEEFGLQGFIALSFYQGHR